MIPPTYKPKKKFMQLAIAEAKRARDRGDYPIGAVITRVVGKRQLPLPHRALAFNVRRPGFEADDVLLLELQFGGILNGHYALVVRNESREHVQQRGFAGAGAAGN